MMRPCYITDLRPASNLQCPFLLRMHQSSFPKTSVPLPMSLCFADRNDLVSNTIFNLVLKFDNF